MVSTIAGLVWLCLAGTPLGPISVTPDRTAAPVYSRITLRVAHEATQANPFDSSDFRVDAAITPPEGEPWTVPGFLYQAFDRRLEDGVEKLEPSGEPEWQVRLSFAWPGAYRVVVTVADSSDSASSEPIELEVTSADVPGMTRRHPDDSRYFTRSRGGTFFPVGANVCWGGRRGTYNYDEWLPKYAENGCNFFRVWLNPAWVTFAMNTPETGFDRIDLANAWRLDHVVELAERLGMQVMVCIDSFNILRSKKKKYGKWEDGPYIRANGGPLEHPTDYFTNEVMLEAYRDRLRYLVARYGYSSSVFAWEFWNEVDIVDDYDSETITRWHRDMARHLRSIDPHRRLITTSHAGPGGDPQLDALPELDFAQTHRYRARDMAAVLLEDRMTKDAAGNRPHFHGEFGIDHNGQAAKLDPTGIHIHNALYASIGQLQAGTPMTWWWDSYIEPQNLYPIYGAFSRWIGAFDFAAQAVRPVTATFELGAYQTARTPGDDLLEPTMARWDPCLANEPTTVEVSREGHVRHDVPLSRVLHGLRNHPDLHNPVTFEVDAPRRTKFGVVVDGVSGHGGAALEVFLDGEPVLRKVFDDNSEDTETITKYDRVYDIRVPRGRHTVKVENTGNDWFYVAYRIPWLDAPGPLRALGVQGRDRGLVWVQNRAHTWRNALEDDFQPVPVIGATLCLENWPAGRWNIETWNTSAGSVTKTRTVVVEDDARLEVPLPPIDWDVAYRIVKTPR